MPNDETPPNHSNDTCPLSHDAYDRALAATGRAATPARDQISMFRLAGNPRPPITRDDVDFEKRRSE